MDEFAVSIEHSEAKSVSASGGLRPLTPDQGLCPWTPLEAPPPDPPYRLALRALAMAPLDCSLPAGEKLTKWPAVSKRLDSTDLEDLCGSHTAYAFFHRQVVGTCCKVSQTE